MLDRTGDRTDESTSSDRLPTRSTRSGNAPGVVTPRDIDLLRYLTRHGVCTGEQLAHRFFADSTAVWRRLRALEHLGLIARHRTWWREPRVVLATPLGSNLADVDLTPARLNLHELRHSLALVDLSEALLAQSPGSQWITERELRRDLFRQVQEGGMHPGLPRHHVPDGLLSTGSGEIAVELELTNKRTRAYEQLFRGYAATPELAAVWWFSGSAPCRQRLTELAVRYQLQEFVRVLPWTPSHIDGRAA